MGVLQYKAAQLFSALVLVTMTMVAINLVVFNVTSLDFSSSKEVSPVDKRRCGPPTIPAWHESAVKNHHNETNKCKTKLSDTLSGKPAFTIQQGRWLQRHADLGALGVSCCYRPFFGIDPMSIRYSNFCININLAKTQIPSDIDFIEVLCHDYSNTTVHLDAFPLVHIKKMEKASSPVSNSLLNVVIVGLDSTSRLNFKRLMPRSSEFLLQQLGAVDLEEYSVVGQNTYKNILPLLTGLSYGDAAMQCVKSVDVCRSLFIWTAFAKMGYVTSLSEDKYSWATKKDFKNAFVNNTELTFYNGPLELHNEKHIQYGYCVGPHVVLKLYFDFMESVSLVARAVRKPYFQWSFFSRISHESRHLLALGESHLLQFLTAFKLSPGRNDTVLIVLGDHGHNDISTGMPEGKQLEYGLPVGYIVLPSWFPQVYPEKFSNLKDNARRAVVTPYDMHATLREILQLSSNNKKATWNGRRFGTSLFGRISIKSCLEAGISLRFCRKCYPEIVIQPSDPLVLFAADTLLKEVNSQVKGLQNMCRYQTLKRTDKVSKWDPKDVSRELCNTYGYSDQSYGRIHGNFVTENKFYNISCIVETEVVNVIDVELLTNPIGARYRGQVMVKQNRSDGKILNTYHLTDEVQRVDMYRHTGRCVSKDKQPFCICSGV